MCLTDVKRFYSVEASIIYYELSALAFPSNLLLSTILYIICSNVCLYKIFNVCCKIEVDIALLKHIYLLRYPSQTVVNFSHDHRRWVASHVIVVLIKHGPLVYVTGCTIIAGNNRPANGGNSPQIMINFNLQSVIPLLVRYYSCGFLCIRQRTFEEVWPFHGYEKFLRHFLLWLCYYDWAIYIRFTFSRSIRTVD